MVDCEGKVLAEQEQPGNSSGVHPAEAGQKSWKANLVRPAEMGMPKVVVTMDVKATGLFTAMGSYLLHGCQDSFVVDESPEIF